MDLSAVTTDKKRKKKAERKEKPKKLEPIGHDKDCCNDPSLNVDLE